MSDLRIAVLGVGQMGAFHVETLSTRVRGAQVSVINDFFADKAEQVAAQVGARAVGDPIERSTIPISTPCCSPPRRALNRSTPASTGIPVLCEKPLTTDVPSAFAIVQKEAALGRRLVQVGFMRRFDPEYVALKDLIVAGGLGNPLMVHCIHRNPAVADHFTSEFMIATRSCTRSTPCGSSSTKRSRACR